VAQMQSLLRVLAAVHGHFWESPGLDALADEPARNGGSAVLDFSDQVLYQADNFQHMMRLPRASVVPQELRDLVTARHYLGRLIRTFDQGPRTLIHGDAHLGNTFHTQCGVEAGFIDWQTYTRGHWAFDVSYLLCTGLTPDSRRRHEQHLLAYYLAELERFGGRSSGMTTAWQSYRRMAFYGFAWAICPPELQPEDVCRACAERVVTAIADLGTLHALDDPL
jgi:aminoglycoside phosphotransferase (APT) family kinase protein